MDVLDSMSWFELGMVWVGLAAAFALAEFLLTSQSKIPPPRLEPRHGLKTERLDNALQEFGEHLDALREFAEAPPGIGREEINRFGGVQADKSVVVSHLSAAPGGVDTPRGSSEDR